jgi:hypothetical protein
MSGRGWQFLKIVVEAMLLPVPEALGERDNMLKLPLACEKERQDAVCKVNRTPQPRHPISDSAIGDLQIAGERRLPLTPVERLTRYLEDVLTAFHFPDFRKMA